MPKNDILCGIHAVSEALRAGRGLERVVVARGAKNPRLREIVLQARSAGVAVRFEPRGSLDRFARSDNHQDVAASAAAAAYRRLEDVLAELSSPGLLVVLDGVEDPRNLGAIIRSAYAAGADALVVAERRSPPLGKTAARTAAGALEYLSIVRVKNINRSLKDLKQAGFWVLGLDERGSQEYDQADLTARTALVLGGEGSGLHRLTAERCDALLRIPMAGRVPSLNVSVAAGVVLFEASKQRRHASRQAQANRAPVGAYALKSD